jgi:hypothetical protein
MRLVDLILDANGRTLSHTKLWANVAFACASFAFTRMALGYPATVPSEIWWAFLGCVGASGAASKLMSLRYSGQSDIDAAQTPQTPQPYTIPERG